MQYRARLAVPGLGHPQRAFIEAFAQAIGPSLGIANVGLELVEGAADDFVVMEVSAADEVLASQVATQTTKDALIKVGFATPSPTMVEIQAVQLEGLIRDAISSAGGLSALLASYGTNPSLGWRADSFPLFTLYRLESWGGVQFKAALALLRDPETALAAEVILRGLIDLLVELDWIVEASPQGSDSVRCRALCYELEIPRRFAKAEGVKVDPEAQRLIAQRRALLTDWLTQSACHPCPDRDQRSRGKPSKWAMTNRVKALGAKIGVPQLVDYWTVASMSVHQTNLDRILEGAGQGERGLPTPATVKRRLLLLEHVSAIYALTVHLVLKVDRAEAAHLPLESFGFVAGDIGQLRLRLPGGPLSGDRW